MPPKRLAMAQEIRDAFTEDASLAEVERWSTVVIADLQKFVAKAQDAQRALAKGGAKYAAPTPAAAAQTPEDILVMLQEYQALARGVYLSAETIRTVISVRIPESKEEDNLGVAVQMAVLRQLDGIQNRLLGSAGGDKDGGVNAAAGMYVAREYLAARADVEGKILGGGEKKDGKGDAPVAPSLLRQLLQVDSDYLLKAELAAAQTTTQLRAFINSYAVNWKKLIQPRNNTGGGMVT